MVPGTSYFPAYTEATTAESLPATLRACSSSAASTMTRNSSSVPERLRYFPLDLPYFTSRILNIVNPKVIVLVETEIWPNFLRVAESKNIPVMMMNGRISNRSASRYRLITFFTRHVLSSIRVFCMQSRIDAQYIISIGADPNKVIVTGNTKYDQTYGIVTEEERGRLRKEMGFNDDAYPIMIAGSTHKGENIPVYKAFVKVKEQFPQAKLIIAPRYIHRSYPR